MPLLAFATLMLIASIPVIFGEIRVLRSHQGSKVLWLRGVLAGFCLALSFVAILCFYLVAR